MKIVPVQKSITFGEIDGPDGYFSMRNLGKTEGQIYEESRIAYERYLEKQKIKSKNNKLNELQKSIEGKTLTPMEKVIFTLKKLKIKLS